MKLKLKSLSCALLFFTTFVYAEEQSLKEIEIIDEKPNMRVRKKKRSSHQAEKSAVIMQQSTHLFKAVLSNGMTVIVRPVHEIPKVSMQIWYRVGSKDEEADERGIAHLIEHMIFKGTEKMLSESDINVLVHKLSGDCNAFTSYDYTGYLFNVPAHYWHEILAVMADCMQNVRFDKNMLASEMKAVIQELKLGRDNYVRSLTKELLADIFFDHPYHHPTIGYKQDLWNADPELLRAFYKKHYLPNNATLVVVGDVDPCDVVARAEEYFGSIPANPAYAKEKFYHNRDLVTKAVTLHRDIKQPMALVCWEIPGVSQCCDSIVSALEFILGKGRSSRLYQKLVHELQLVTSLSVGALSLFEHGILIISFEPKHIADMPRIEAIINEELASIARDGVSIAECERALNKMRMELYGTLEDIQEQAYLLGYYYLATGNPEYIFTSLDITPQLLADQVKNFVGMYLRPSLVQKGAVMPLMASEHDVWHAMQTNSDKEDAAILAFHKRETPVEPARYADTVEVKLPEPFPFPKAQVSVLDNGVKLLWHVNKNTPQVTVSLSLRAKSYYDDVNKQGLGTCVAMMLKEGTTKHSATEFATLIESRGMALSTAPGSIEITALKQDLPFALEVLYEVLTTAAFEEAALKRVRAQLISSIHNFWDEPKNFAGQLIREAIYKNHPYAKNSLGTIESVNSFTVDDLKEYYARYISPDGARLAIVGDIGDFDVPALVNEKLGTWQGPKVAEIEFPPVPDTEAQLIDYPINRDQIVLAFAKKSIARTEAPFDPYLIYTQVFGGGDVADMSSRLFELREASGLFYTISGSLLTNTDEQPGLLYVKTIVSKDRLAEAEKVIKGTIAHAHETLTDVECEEAKLAIVNAIIDYFSSNAGIAHTFLFLDRFNLPERYFDDRAQQLEPITAAAIKQAVANLMNPDNLVTLRIGRVE